ncbi:hypothetical protein H4R34_000471 [Dimargaris verticillata]|uniref:Sfi1 spindle body domain-containing protein n=1 Tax=Dimargaris verticillata TaxID=2761393 RepID=A0A9W8BCJ1_9FUNG|nr:hypothetical protein H4R34_000471 [Dimargaris verticillata]
MTQSMAVNVHILLDILQTSITQQGEYLDAKGAPWQPSPTKSNLFSTYVAVLRKNRVDPAHDILYYQYLKHIAQLPGTKWADKFAHFLHSQHLPIPAGIVAAPAFPTPGATQSQPNGAATVNALPLAKIQKLIWHRRAQRLQAQSTAAHKPTVVDARLYFEAWKKYTAVCKKRKATIGSLWQQAKQFRRTQLLRHPWQWWHARVRRVVRPRRFDHPSRYSVSNESCEVLGRLADEFFCFRLKSHTFARLARVYNCRLHWYQWQERSATLCQRRLFAKWQRRLRPDTPHDQDLERLAHSHYAHKLLERFSHRLARQDRLVQQALNHRQTGARRCVWQTWRAAYYRRITLQDHLTLFVVRRDQHRQRAALHVLRLFTKLQRSEHQRQTTRLHTYWHHWIYVWQQRVYRSDRAAGMAESLHSQIARHGIRRWYRLTRGYIAECAATRAYWHHGQLSQAFAHWQLRSGQQTQLCNQAVAHYHATLLRSTVLTWVHQTHIHQRLALLRAQWDSRQTQRLQRRVLVALRQQASHRARVWSLYCWYTSSQSASLRLRYLLRMGRRYRTIQRRKARAQQQAQDHRSMAALNALRQQANQSRSYRVQAHELRGMLAQEGAKRCLRAWSIMAGDLSDQRDQVETRVQQRQRKVSFTRWRAAWLERQVFSAYQQSLDVAKQWQMGRWLARWQHARWIHRNEQVAHVHAHSLLHRRTASLLEKWRTQANRRYQLHRTALVKDRARTQRIATRYLEHWIDRWRAREPRQQQAVDFYQHRQLALAYCQWSMRSVQHEDKMETARQCQHIQHLQRAWYQWMTAWRAKQVCGAVVPMAQFTAVIRQRTGTVAARFVFHFWLREALEQQRQVVVAERFRHQRWLRPLWHTWISQLAQVYEHRALETHVDTEPAAEIDGSYSHGWQDPSLDFANNGALTTVSDSFIGSQAVFEDLQRSETESLSTGYHATTYYSRRLQIVYLDRWQQLLRRRRRHHLRARRTNRLHRHEIAQTEAMQVPLAGRQITLTRPRQVLFADDVESGTQLLIPGHARLQYYFSLWRHCHQQNRQEAASPSTWQLFQQEQIKRQVWLCRAHRALSLQSQALKHWYQQHLAQQLLHQRLKAKAQRHWGRQHLAKAYWMLRFGASDQQHRRKLASLREKLCTFQAAHSLAPQWLRWVAQCSAQPIRARYALYQQQLVNSELQPTPALLPLVHAWPPSAGLLATVPVATQQHLCAMFLRTCDQVARRYYCHRVFFAQWNQWKARYYYVTATHGNHVSFARTWATMAYLRKAFRQLQTQFHRRQNAAIHPSLAKTADPALPVTTIPRNRHARARRRSHTQRRR